ncbi:cyclic pyranopterin monophosphate synthase MoaC [Myxococcota bacterium]|nr:cyclic pyranopterin monophosphate synthase MoaC [Myxococcota bacterium]
MVDVGAKPATARRAIAEAFVRMRPDTVRLLADRALAKGDALAVARIAGIQAAKRTPDLIPLAHPLLLTHVAVELDLEDDGVRIETRVETTSSTGVEMEALTAAAAAALSIYDMAKKHDREMVIERVQLLVKTGGQSGDYVRKRTGV